MKTIAIFHPSSELYGADRIMVNALKALPAQVNKRLYLKFNGPLVDFVKSEVQNITVIIKPDLPIIYRKIYSLNGIFKFIMEWVKFISFIKREHHQYNFKSAYLNTLSTVFILIILSRLRIANFIHVHEIIERPRLVGYVTAWLCKIYTDKVICVSKAVLDGLRDYVPSLSKKSQILHNGILPIEVGDKKMSSCLNFYLFGRIMPKKGQWLLIDSLKYIPESVLKKCRFIFVGGILDGHEHLMVDLKNKIKEEGLNEYVEIKGFTSNISIPMNEADVCLVPSVMKDPFPTTVLEAMSAGKPVIATDHGGAREVIIDGVTGFLIKHNEPEKLAVKIARLVTDRRLIRELGRNAKSRYTSAFTIRHFNRKWLLLNVNNNFI